MGCCGAEKKRETFCEDFLELAKKYFQEDTKEG
jgi:hypothetical protein